MVGIAQMLKLRRALVTAPLASGTPVWFSTSAPLASDAASIAQRGYVIAVEPENTVVVRRCDHPRQHRLPLAHVEVRLTHDAEASEALLRRAAEADPEWTGDATWVESIVAAVTRQAIDDYTVALAARTPGIANVACAHLLGSEERLLLQRAVVPLLRDSKIGLAVSSFFCDLLATNVTLAWKANRPDTGGCLRDDRCAIDLATNAIRTAVDAWVNGADAARLAGGATLVCALDGGSPWHGVGAWYKPK